MAKAAKTKKKTTTKKVVKHKVGKPNTITVLKTPITVYKKVVQNDFANGDMGPLRTAIATLIIPKGASVRWGELTDNTYTKNRASKAKVVKIRKIEVDFKTYNKKLGKTISVAYSEHDPDFKYEVGKTVEPVNNFDDSPEIECSSGIHFFMTVKEAKEW